MTAFEEFFQYFLSFRYDFSTVFPLRCRQSASGFGRGDEVESFLFGCLRFGGEYFRLVAAMQFLVQRY